MGWRCLKLQARQDNFMQILVAEDDRTSRWALEAILKKAGYEVIATSNGKEAWQAMQVENPPPLALVDWMMPGMDGLEFCRKVRKSAALSSTYIIFLTNKRQKDDHIVAIESGANDYICKPFDRKELLIRLHVAEGLIEAFNNNITKGSCPVLSPSLSSKS